MIEALVHTRTQAELALFAKKNDVSENRLHQIQKWLHHLSFIEPAIPDQQHPLLFPEYQAHWRIYGHLPHSRQQMQITIPKLDWLSTEITLSLAAAGVRNFTLLDTSISGPLSHPIFQNECLGMRKNLALASYLRANLPQMQTVSLTESSLQSDFPQRSLTHLAIITGHHGIDPLLINRYLGAQIPVLVATIGEIDITAGPFLIPQIGPCGMCLAYYRQDIDENWAALAPQAAALKRLPIPLASAKLAASFLFRAALEYLDTYNFANSARSRDQVRKTAENPDNHCTLFAKAWKIPPIPELPQLMPLTRHPKCRCHWFASNNQVKTITDMPRDTGESG
ncbi:hypothetical protein [Arcanobacterium hippocoleae]|uniref:hypothetical protein n=1 Tax=Arcanobacterium hippocoleae TaxID=149017 RepID=UPI003342D231